MNKKKDRTGLHYYRLSQAKGMTHTYSNRVSHNTLPHESCAILSIQSTQCWKWRACQGSNPCPTVEAVVHTREFHDVKTITGPVLRLRFFPRCHRRDGAVPELKHAKRNNTSGTRTRGDTLSSASRALVPFRLHLIGGTTARPLGRNLHPAIIPPSRNSQLSVELGKRLARCRSQRAHTTRQPEP